MDAGAAWQSLNPMVELRVGGPVHLAHPALANEGGNCVGTEGGAGVENHVGQDV